LAALTIGLVSIGVVASPAAAAGGRSLPEGSSLYAVQCDDENLAPLALFSLDTITAAATPVGPGTPASDADCAGQAAWNPVTSTAYVTVWYYEGEIVPIPAVLATIDPTTGVSSPVAPFTLAGEFHDVDSIAIGNDGAAYAIDDDFLYSLDLANATLTELGDLSDGAFYGFSVDPTTGAFYAIQPSGDIFTIDVVTHTATLLVSTQLGGDSDRPYSLQIDTDGTFWIQADITDPETENLVSNLWSITGDALADSPLLSGAITAPSGRFYTESLLYVPAPIIPVVPVVPVVPAAVVVPVVPTLANTGVDAAPLAAGGALVALLGVALLVPAIRRRRATA
jgi:hypothetical protein